MTAKFRLGEFLLVYRGIPGDLSTAGVTPDILAWAEGYSFCSAGNAGFQRCYISQSQRGPEKTYSVYRFL